MPRLQTMPQLSWAKPLALTMAFAMTFVAISAPSQSAAQERNNIVAVVNADPITRKTLADACVVRFGKDVLENMVNRHLILQACQSHGINITEKEVREEIDRVAKKFGLTMESYLGLLEKERDIAPDQYSREIIWPMLALRQLVADKVQVTQEEFNKAFSAQYGEAVKCRLIMTAKREKALLLQQQATADPESFSALAKKHSEDPASASVGGLIPPIRRNSGDSRLEEAAFGLKDGGVSEVLQLGDQWIVLQAVRRIPASTPSAQAMPVIRDQINDQLRDQKMRNAATELFSKLQKDARVVLVLGNEELSKQHPGVAAIINGEKVMIDIVAEECIKRHGLDVLEGEINRKLLNQALRSVGKTITQDDVNQEVASAAVKVGYVRGDGSPDVEGWLESVTADGKMTRQLYFDDAVWPSVALRKLVEDSVKVTADDLKEGFESSYGPRVEVLAIVLGDQRSAQKIWEMARDNPTDEFFGQLAEQYSIEPASASNRGKVPPIRKFSGQPAIEREAFQLKPGDLSGIIVAGDKYIVLRCQGYTEPIVTDLSDVRDELLRDLHEKKLNRAMTRQFEAMIDNAEIDNFLAASKESTRIAGEKPQPRK